MSKITWTNDKCKLSDLTPWPRNPRQIKRDQAERLVKSFEEFDQVDLIAVGPNGEIYNGHQRLNVLIDKYGGDYEVEVRRASRELTEKEREKLTVYLHKGAAGEWDFDVLANEFELEDLLDWGFDEDELLGVDYKNPILSESDEPLIRPREMMRILISVPVDMAIEAKEHIDDLAEIEGIEILYGAN